MGAKSPAAQLNSFLAKYRPETASDARASLARLRKLLPGAVEMVYDNYNALVIGFGPSERASHAVVSLAVLPDHVTLCFLQDAPQLPDPRHLLKGEGRVVRNIPLESASDLDQPPIKTLISEALKRAVEPIDSSRARRLVIKSISAKQRPRR